MTDRKYNQSNKIMDVDNIYMNVDINYDDPLVISNKGSAKFSVTRTSPIVHNANDYEISICRFSVPTANIPILFLDDTEYIFRLKTPTGEVNTVLTIPVNTFNSTYGRQALYTYSQFVFSLNEQIAQQWAILPGALGPPPSILFNSVTKLFTYYFPTTGWIGPGLSDFEMSFNEELFFLFGAVPVFAFFQTGTFNAFYNFVVNTTPANTETINGVDYAVIEQDYSTLATWAEFLKLRFTTNSIPVVSELDSSQTPVLSKVLTDFTINVQDGGLDAQVVVYEPTGDLRFYSLESSNEIRQIDLGVEFLDARGRSYPVYLSPGETVSVKLLFRRIKTL
jgi:hypothetical protein